jgi:hypothetical protein
MRLTEAKRGIPMQFDKQFVIDELEKQGKSEHVQHALDQLPEKIDHNQHAALLEKFGLDPGQLAEKAAKEGLTKL